MNAETLKALDVRSKDTAAIHRIFGGYLQSTVTCSTCHHVSRTFDQFKMPLKRQRHMLSKSKRRKEPNNYHYHGMVSAYILKMFV